jgi:hypothetical protein
MSPPRMLYICLINFCVGRLFGLYFHATKIIRHCGCHGVYTQLKLVNAIISHFIQANKLVDGYIASWSCL